MTVDQVSLLLALLAGVALAVTIAIAVVAYSARRSAAIADRWSAWRDEFGMTALLAAAIVAFTATAGSLYLSEVANFPPCRLCWYQRIAEYPLGPLLLLAWIRRDHGIRPYVVLLAGLGAVISTYHVLLERIPSLETGACELDNPCSIRWVEHFGFVTIPVMALCTFATVIALTLTVPKES